MSSPFVYEDPVAPDDIVDREEQAATLLDRALSCRNSRIEAPRRYGKTSLVRKVLHEASDEGRATVYVNFLGVLSADDVAARIDRAYAESLDGAVRRWFTGVLRTLRPTVGAGVAPVSVSVSPQPEGQVLLERLALPRRLHERTGQRSLIVFDEFQAVLAAGPSIDQVIRSEIEGHRDVAGYIFSGSHPHLMRDLFANRARAFFGQAAPVELGPLPADALAAHLTERFAAHRRDPGAALGPLLDLVRGHPQRAMLCAHHLFEATPSGASATEDTWAVALDRAWKDARGEIEVLWGNVSFTQQRVLAAVAADVPLAGAEALRRFQLPKSGGTRQAADALEAEGHLVPAETASRFSVVDPFLHVWLAAGRRWPGTDGLG